MDMVPPWQGRGLGGYGAAMAGQRARWIWCRHGKAEG